MTAAWRQYEQEVVAALRLVDPNATVLWDHRVPDRRTNTPRQVDAWIEARVCTQKVRIVGSCKYLARPVDVSHIDHLKGEVAALGGHSGMIFSKEGFTDTAIEAAKAEGFSCCLLVGGDGATFQSPLMLRSYLLRLNLTLGLIGPTARSLTGTWGEFFLRPATEAGVTNRVVDIVSTLAESAAEQTVRARADLENRRLSSGFGLVYHALRQPDRGLEVSVEVGVVARVYEARLEAMQLSGVVNITEDMVHSSVTGPPVDTWSIDPGPGWRELHEPPESLPAAAFALFLRPGLSADDLLKTHGSRPLPTADEVAGAEGRFQHAQSTRNSRAEPPPATR